MAGIRLLFDSRYVYSPFTGRGMTGDPNALGTKSTGSGAFCHTQNRTGMVDTEERMFSACTHHLFGYGTLKQYPKNGARELWRLQTG